MGELRVQVGSEVAPQKYRIEITDDGPYLVYGAPPMMQQIIMPDENGGSWTYKSGQSFDTEPEPIALCRCGHSKDKPYCDGTHSKGGWDHLLARPDDSILDCAEQTRGPVLNITDNIKYCAFARFCDPKGKIWNLVSNSDPESVDLTIREANHCPAGRLSAWDKRSKKPYEPILEQSLGLIQDPMIKCSGPLWVRGGIPISTQQGYKYEVRNRVTLCRCGQSSNKPFCDGTHAAMLFDDDLPKRPAKNGEEF